MLEMYLLSRIGAIHTALSWLTVGLFIAWIICWFMVALREDFSDEHVLDEDQRARLKKNAKKLLYSLAVSFLVLVVTPTEKDAYLIYGLGGTIDYIQSNDKAKQIPDKCIEALNTWLDKIQPDETSNK